MLTQHDFVPYIINKALNHHFYSDAVFLAERLHAEAATEISLHLLATCYYRAGKKQQAYGLLKSGVCVSPQCKFLLGKCCFDLNKLTEAEIVLAGDTVNTVTADDICSVYGETAPFVLSLLAEIYRKTQRQAKSSEMYRTSLSRNPFLWSSFAALCQAGETVDPAAIFSESNVHPILQAYRQSPSGHAAPGYGPLGWLASSAVTSSPASPRMFLPMDGQQEVQSQPMPLVADPISGEVCKGSPASIASNSFLVPPLPLSAGPVYGAASSDNSASAGRLKGSVEHGSFHRARVGAGSASRFSGFGPSPLPLAMATPSTGIDLPSIDTPSPASLDSSPFITPATTNAQPELPPPVKKVVGVTRKGSGTGVSKLVFSQSTSNARHEVELNTPPPVPALTTGHLHNSQSVRRSSRIFANQNSSSVKENNSKTQGHAKAFGLRSASMRGRSAKSDDELNELNKRTPAAASGGVGTDGSGRRPLCDTAQQQIEQLQLQSAVSLLTLLRHVGEGYFALQQFRCRKAVESFLEVPAKHLKTGWMMSQLAKAWFEMSDYRKAEEVFTEVRQIAPYRLEDMEVFSTALWHLQKDAVLSALALELGGVDVSSPQVWCVRGNCFSLQKEHETAIKFFQRAIQVDPEFAYAYSLLGHEYTLVEDFDKAMSSFRNALRIDPRRYNAWYGVGLIYYKQEKFVLAESHFKKALSINPQSPVLLCHIGVVQHALAKPDLALATFNRALTFDPNHPLCKFRKATVLLAKDRLQDALRELEELRDIEPKESLVYFLLGKVHKKLGNSHLSLLNFSWAMDLDPKGANNHIKEAIDKRYVTDDELLSSPGASEMDHDQSEEATPVVGSAADAGGSTGMRALLMEADDGEAQLVASESDESL